MLPGKHRENYGQKRSSQKGMEDDERTRNRAEEEEEEELGFPIEKHKTGKPLASSRVPRD